MTGISDKDFLKTAEMGDLGTSNIKFRLLDEASDISSLQYTNPTTEEFDNFAPITTGTDNVYFPKVNDAVKRSSCGECGEIV